ncbi:ParB-like nuclease domain protein [Microbacterium phage MementoMori]|uniref:ParB-like nuclease domain protein n=1 Tax=Microbacterium phage MementoMori TaxID=2201436 RepID=A0A2Z4Q5D8_9CAUD|nr:ParB-like partition protein [Microbacterium phage MementoMori]AWY05256.1 ParB-like nuclease domain protein [Microbacterium phage MementoMori]
MIEYEPLSGLRPDPRNPKGHDESTIGESISRFGYIEPVTVDDRTGLLIGGHGRVKALTAAKAAGHDAPDGIRVRDDGEWLIPVNRGWASASDAEAAGALIALNRATQLGGWVDDALLDLLQEVDATGPGLGGTGFDLGDVDDISIRLEEEGDPDSADLDEYRQKYAEQARRLIVLSYSKEDYARLNVLLARARARWDSDSNPDTILQEMREVAR